MNAEYLESTPSVPTNVINNYVNLEVSFEQTLNDIRKSSFSDSDKEEMQCKIQELEKLKGNKKTFWEKSANVLKWAIEKGIDVFRIFAPYVLQASSGNSAS